METQTQPFQNRNHLVLVRSGALNRKAPTTSKATDPSQFPRIIKLSIRPRFGSDHQLRPDSILARTCFYVSVAKNSTGEEKLGRRLYQNISPHALVLSRLDYCNSVLANLPEVTLAPLIRIQHSAARLRKRRLFIRGP